MRAASLLLLAALTLSACASYVANRYYGAETFAPKAQSEVQILWAKPDRPFKVIADFQSRGESAEDLQLKAAQIGADAVLVKILGGQYERSEQWAGHDTQSNTYSRIVGTAIKFTAL